MNLVLWVSVFVPSVSISLGARDTAMSRAKAKF